MKQAATEIRISTRGQGLHNITTEIAGWVKAQGFQTGLLTIFITHTSASLTIQENADPDVCQDLTDYFMKLAPRSHTAYRHSSEGLDDMPAHIKSVLTDVQISIPLVNHRLSLGTWQGVYVFEHRDRPHTRRVALHLIGE